MNADTLFLIGTVSDMLFKYFGSVKLHSLSSSCALMKKLNQSAHLKENRTASQENSNILNLIKNVKFSTFVNLPHSKTKLSLGEKMWFSFHSMKEKTGSGRLTCRKLEL